MPDDAPPPPPSADDTLPEAKTLAAADSTAAADDDGEWEYVDEDEDEDDAPAEAPPTAAAGVRARPRWLEIVALSGLCVVLGGMLAGAALGVLYAPARGTLAASPGHVAAALARPTDDLARSAATHAPDASADGAAVAVAGDAGLDGEEAGPPQEANPEMAGDGVMDDLDDGPAEPVPAATPTTAAAAPRPLLARAEPPHAATPTPSGSGRRVVTSDDVPEGPAQGYVHGRAARITVTRIDGKPVEVHTAAAFRRMREAAQRDGVTIRIASGFRTMEHQQALYRAYRQGRGNLAALPGHSNHQSGHALDLNTSTPGVFRWLTRQGRRFGFRRTVPTEPWHWEWW